MAEQIESDKGFLILKVDKQDLNKIGSPAICDWCSDNIKEGYYIAVLNSIYCDHCYKQWHEQAKYCQEDCRIELKNFTFYKRMFQPGDADYHLSI